MRQFFKRNPMTQKLTNVGQCTAFNNVKSPYPIVNIKKPRNDKCKSIQTRKLMD